MVLIIEWLAFAAVAGVVANGRGRSGLGYFLISVALSPLIGILLAVALPNRLPAIERQADPVAGLPALRRTNQARSGGVPPLRPGGRANGSRSDPDRRALPPPWTTYADRTIEGLVTFMLQYRHASNSVYNPNPAF
jgi:hypothetical protein